MMGTEAHCFVCGNTNFIPPYPGLEHDHGKKVLLRKRRRKADEDEGDSGDNNEDEVRFKSRRLRNNRDSSVKSSFKVVLGEFFGKLGLDDEGGEIEDERVRLEGQKLNEKFAICPDCFNVIEAMVRRRRKCETAERRIKKAQSELRRELEMLKEGLGQYLLEARKIENKIASRIRIEESNGYWTWAPRRKTLREKLVTVTEEIREFQTELDGRLKGEMPFRNTLLRPANETSPRRKKTVYHDNNTLEWFSNVLTQPDPHVESVKCEVEFSGDGEGFSEFENVLDDIDHNDDMDLKPIVDNEVNDENGSDYNPKPESSPASPQPRKYKLRTRTVNNSRSDTRKEQELEDSMGLSQISNKLLKHFIQKAVRSSKDEKSSLLGAPDHHLEYDRATGVLTLGGLEVLVSQNANSVHCSACSWKFSITDLKKSANWYLSATRRAEAAEKRVFNHVIGEHLGGFKCPNCNVAFKSLKAIQNHCRSCSNPTSSPNPDEGDESEGRPKRKKKIKICHTPTKEVTDFDGVDLRNRSYLVKHLILRALRGHLERQQESSNMDDDNMDDGAQWRRFHLEYDKHNGQLHLGEVQIILNQEENSVQCSACSVKLIWSELKVHSTTELKSSHLTAVSMEKRIIGHIIGFHLGGYDCPKCDRVFEERTKYCVHVATSHLQFPCDICGKPIASKKHLKKHRFSHMNVEEKTEAGFFEEPEVDPEADIDRVRFPCVNCGKVFKFKSQLFRHEQTHLAKEDREMERVICPLCGKNILRESYAKHKIYVCPLPGTGTAEGFTELGQVHRIQCPHCPAILKTKGTYEEHKKRYHSKGEGDEQDRTCPQCRKVLKTRWEFDKHLRHYCKMKSWKCGKGCGRKFRQKANSVKHETICSGVRKKTPTKSSPKKAKKRKANHEGSGRSENSNNQDNSASGSGYQMGYWN